MTPSEDYLKFFASYLEFAVDLAKTDFSSEVPHLEDDTLYQRPYNFPLFFHRDCNDFFKEIYGEEMSVVCEMWNNYRPEILFLVDKYAAKMAGCEPFLTKLEAKVAEVQKQNAEKSKQSLWNDFGDAGGDAAYEALHNGDPDSPEYREAKKIMRHGVQVSGPLNDPTPKELEGVVVKENV